MSRFIIIILSAVLFAACGGSSGSNNGINTGGNGGGQSSNVVVLSKYSLNFQIKQYDINIPPETVLVSWSDSRVAAIVVGYPPNIPEVNWLSVSTANATSPVTLSFRIGTANNDLGTKSTTIRVAATDSAGNVINFRDIAINYTVIERPKITVDGNSSLTFFAIAGGEVLVDGNLVGGQTVKLAGDNVEWFSRASDDWVYIDTSAGTTPSTLKIAANPSGLSAGQYTGTATFADNRSQTNAATFNITANIQTALGFDGANTLAFDLADGQTNVEEQELKITGQGVNWSAQADEPWVSLGSTQGQANSILKIGANIGALAPGEYSSKVTITDTDSNYDQSIEAIINVNIEPRKVIAMDTGIAFASMPTLSKLSSKVMVSDNGGENIPWAATSNAAWLAVTPNGQTGSGITLMASPVGLGTDTLYMADVTITSSNPKVITTEVIKVGFWVGATDINGTDSNTSQFTEIITDPIRPYVYVHNGQSEFKIYNIHTATLVNTVVVPTVSQASDMAITDNGEFLYIFDKTNFKIVEINLTSHAVGRSWDTGTSANRITFGRVDAKPILFVDNGKFINIELGSISDGTYGGGGNGNIDVSQDGKKLCKINSGISPYSLACYTLKYSQLTDELSVNYIGNVAHGSGSNGRDLVLSPDGSRVYAASGAPYIFIGFDTTTMQKDQELPANAFPNNVEIGSDGFLYGGIANGSNPADVWIYDKNGVEQANYSINSYAGEIEPRQLRVSGDALRMILLTDDPSMEFVTVK